MDPKKKKILMFSLIGLGVVVVILAIVLPLTLIKDEKKGDGKVTPAFDLFPFEPFKFPEYNPYRNVSVRSVTTSSAAYTIQPMV